MKPWHWWIVAIFFLLPLQGAAVLLDVWLTEPPKPTGDGPDYEAIGFELSRGNGWSTHLADPAWREPYANSHRDYFVQLSRPSPSKPETNRPPLYPLSIATIYQIVPRGPYAFAAVRLFSALCLALAFSLTVYWGVHLGRATDHSQRLALSAGVGLLTILVVYSERNVRNYATDFLTEPLAMLLTQGFWLAAWHATRNPHIRGAALLGLLFAGMYGCRDVFVLWLPLITIWLWFACRFSTSTNRERASLLQTTQWTCVFLGVAIGLMSLWWIRNCAVTGQFTPLGTKGFTTLMGGYCDEALEHAGEWQFAPERKLRAEMETALYGNQATGAQWIESELKISAIAKERVKQWTWEHLSDLPRLMLLRVVTEWNPYTGKALLLKLAALSGLIWLAIFHRTALGWLVVPLAINTFVVMCTYSVGGRFLVPTYGQLYLLAAFGIAGPVASWWAIRHPNSTSPNEPSDRS